MSCTTKEDPEAGPLSEFWKLVNSTLALDGRNRGLIQFTYPEFERFPFSKNIRTSDLEECIYDDSPGSTRVWTYQEFDALLRNSRWYATYAGITFESLVQREINTCQGSKPVETGDVGSSPTRLTPS